MWPQQQRHQHYRVAESPESQQYHQAQHHMQPAMGSRGPSGSADPYAAHREHQQQNMHSRQRQYPHPQQQQHQQLQQHLQEHRDHAMVLATSSNPRATRNMAEKQRRDNLNTNISTMATLVPTVAGSPRRLDKISILRLAAAFLRTEYTLGSGTSGFLPHRFNDFDLEQYFVDNIVGNDGFLIVVTTTGKIVYISRQVEQHLGHAQCDLFGQSLYNFIFPEDHEELTKNLSPEDLNRLAITEAPDDNSSSSEDSSTPRPNNTLFGEQRRSFNVRMSQRSVSRREHLQYECLHISGILRPAAACKNLVSGGDRAGSSRQRELNPTSNDVVFVGTARLMKKRITELSLLEANKDEYVTRHLVDGRIIFSDHRIAFIAGYMTHEVSGMSAFSYMHTEDVLWTIIALRQMYDRGEGFGSSCYRLKTKIGEYIYLRTHAYVEVDKDKQSFESFICVNTSVSQEEGERLSNEMKARYSATISNAESLFSTEDLKALNSSTQRATPSVAVEDPSQLENAIIHLISDLASPPLPEDRVSSPVADTQVMKAALISQRLPPPSIHANQIGIKSIDHTIPSVGKDKYQTIKRESNIGSPSSTHSCQNDNHGDFEESGPQGQHVMSPGRSTNTATTSSGRRGDKIIPELNGNDSQAFNTQEPASQMAYTSRGKDFCKTEASTSNCSTSTMPGEECNFRELSSMDLTGSQDQSHRIANTAIRTVPHRGKPDNMSAYVKAERTDIETCEMIENPTCSKVKRSCVDNSMGTLSKKRRGAARNVGTTYSRGEVEKNDPTCSPYQPTNSQCPQYSGFSDERLISPGASSHQVDNFRASTSDESMLNQRDNHSPSSSLQDLPIDYPSLKLSIYEDERGLDDLDDLQSDSLLGSDLHDNPDFTTIFDDLGPVIGFKKNLEERRTQQFPNNDQNVDEGLRRTHMQLANSLTLQQDELCVIEHELKTPALQSQYFKPRETLIELRAEHKKNTRMLKTIQQDHHNMHQSNVKQNIGV